MTASFPERRKYPRAPETLSCGLTLEGERFFAQTRNISCGGVLAQLSRRLSPMTKLEVFLDLPPFPRDHAARRIRCVGVVVRQAEGLSTASYPTAIYFSEISQEDRRWIAEFVLASMLSHDRRRS
ncbi:MAG: PilZ domain-containing protein [Candidatus Omnitrophica bacterium]|nr:PilZ domain-containing protein [Candidatus Omnitrophota bacterium]